jgi:hypothetical protein
MDELVLRGMAKWPNVPAVYGWLALDRRGQWLIKGERVSNPVISDFIARNYERDSEGRWFFQNGPQRVFVSLEYTPFVFHAARGPGTPLLLVAHTGAEARAARGAWVDENGAVLLDTDVGLGVLDDRDLDAAVAAFVDAAGRTLEDDALHDLIESVQRGEDALLWLEYGGAKVKLAAISSAEAPRRFGYDPLPASPAGHPECA